MEERRWRNMRSQRSQSSGPATEEYFVDQTRNVGVVAGEKDIKIDMNKKMSKIRKGLAFKDIEKDHKALCQRGSQLLKIGDLKSALQLLDKSVNIFKDSEDLDPEPYIERSKCRLKLGMVEEAVEDAEEALKADKTSMSAMKAKAEAMYQFGEFEQALIQYERMVRICPEYKVGIIEKKKNICKDTILTAFQGYTFDPSLVDFTIHEVSKLKNEGCIEPVRGEVDCDEMEAIIKKSETEKIVKGVNTPAFHKDEIKTKLKTQRRSTSLPFRRKTDKDLMGKLLDDAIFLEKLANNPDLEKGFAMRDKRTDYVDGGIGKVVKSHAREAVIYFEKKKEFWMECSIMKPPPSFTLKEKRKYD